MKTATWYRIHIDPDKAPKGHTIERDHDFPDTKVVGIQPLYSCSCCGFKADEGQHSYYNYCPICGSKMERMDIEKEILAESEHLYPKTMAAWKAVLYYTKSYYHLEKWRQGEKRRRKKHKEYRKGL